MYLDKKFKCFSIIDTLDIYLTAKIFNAIIFSLLFLIFDEPLLKIKL